MTLKAKFFLPALVCAITLSTPSYAGIIYTDLGSGNSFDTVYNFGLSSSQTVAESFTVSGSTTIADALLGLASESNTPVDVYIEGDTSGLPNGSTVASFSQVGTVPTSPDLVTFNCASGCTLSAGSYWLVAASTDGGWYQATATTGLIGISGGGIGGPWITVPPPPFGGSIAAFQIEDSSGTTPEPSSMLLTAGAAGALLAFVRRRRQA